LKSRKVYKTVQLPLHESMHNFACALTTTKGTEMMHL